MTVEILRRVPLRLLAAAAAAMLLACGGDSGKSVVLSWNANRESGVNRAGGGYEISISGQPAVDVPWVSGAAAPTTVTASLKSGTYTVTVRAYAALDASGGSTKTYSASSQPITVTVP